MFIFVIKEFWVNSLQMVKFVLEEENYMGWFCVEDDGNYIKKEKYFFFVGYMFVMVVKQQEFKIECVVYNFEFYLNNESQLDLFFMVYGFLWIGSCIY